MKNNHYRLLKHIATLGFVGYLPGAPGTYGTFLALLFIYALEPSSILLLLLILSLFILGTVASHSAEISLKEKDSTHIIIDEFAGYLVSVSFLETGIASYVLAFVFFRIFDIFKPPPVNYLEEYFKGGFGIMVDDLMAGIYANIATRCSLFVAGYFL